MILPMTTNIAYKFEDRQWDCRFNVPTEEYLDEVVEAIKAEDTKGKFKYILIGGVEIGTRPTHTDYQVKHVHVAVIFHNRASKSSILKNWKIKEGLGYYLVPRNRELPYKSWREHHIKEFSKVDPTNLFLYERGELPTDGKRKRQAESSEEEKKLSNKEVLIAIDILLRESKDDEAFKLYPRNYLIYGERMKSRIHQKRDFFKTNGDPHIWLHGFPGTGKTTILQYIYPANYKKNLDNKFFDCFDEKEHTHVILEDLDPSAVERLGLQFLKTICDEAGYAIDQKYKACHLVQFNTLVTSNFTINQVIEVGTQGREQTRAALERRFWEVRVDNFLRALNLKLVPKFDRIQLKRAGNQDMSKLFMTWDYTSDCPMGCPLKSPEMYQTIIRETFYGSQEKLL